MSSKNLPGRVRRVHRLWLKLKRDEYWLYPGSVCKRWLKSFDNFLEDVGEWPTDAGATFEREDETKPYSPSNCYWGLPEWESRGRGTQSGRPSMTITWQGKTQSKRAWAEELGIPLDRLRSRWYKGVRDPDVLFSTGRLKRDRTVKPKSPDKTPIVTYQGKTLTLRQWSITRGLTLDHLQTRYRAGIRGDALFIVGSITKNMVTFMGKTMNLSQWCKYLKISYGTVRRSWKAGERDPRVLFEEYLQRIKLRNSTLNLDVKYEYQGKTLNLTDWSREANIPYHTFYGRWRRGFRGEDLFKPMGVRLSQPKDRSRLVMHEGEVKSLREWALQKNIPYKTLRERWVKGIRGEWLFSTRSIQTARARHVTYRGESHTIREWSEILNLPYHALMQRYRVGDTDPNQLFRPIDVTRHARRKKA